MRIINKLLVDMERKTMAAREEVVTLAVAVEIASDMMPTRRS